MKRILAPTLLAGLLIVLLIQLPAAIAERGSDYEWFDPIIETRRLLSDEFVEKPDAERLQRAAINGLVEALNDPYTVYVPPADLEAFNKELRGTYAGIGAEINQRDGYLLIVSPMDDSPALRAGVRAGDLVLEIEGNSTKDVTPDQCIEWLTGEALTPVTITVRHEDGTEESITIIRDHIVTPTVKGIARHGEAWRYCIGDGGRIGYIRVTQFNANTLAELVEALKACEKADALDGLVLDLRDNPGGGLPSAVGMSDLFLDDGRIVSVRPRDTTREESWDARPGDGYSDFPMIVLVNGASASASEIVSGALKENGRAKVLGTRTYGKGSVQEVRALDFGAGTLKFTIAKYYLPSGRSLHRLEDSTVWGVDPDYLVPVSDDDYIQMLTARRDYEILRHEPNPDDPACRSLAWIRDDLHDPQLARAVTMLETQIDGGTWPDETSDPSSQALRAELDRAIELRRSLLERLDELDERMVELAGMADTDPSPSVLDPELDLVGGELVVRGANGDVLGRFRIDGGRVAEAFQRLELTPVADAAAGDGSGDS